MTIAKKFVSIMLLLTMLFSLSLPVLATGNDVEFSSTSNGTTFHRGDTVKVCFTIGKINLSEGLAGVDINSFDYDTAKLTIVSVSVTTLPAGWSKYGTTAPLMIVDDSGANPTKSTGSIIIEVLFQIRDDALFGTTTVSASGAGTSSGNFESILVGFDSCTITIECVHTWGNWTKVDDNNHKHTCSVCGKSETAAHGWNSGVVTTQPTHTTFGVKTYTCSGCGATKTEQVAKLTEHTYGEWQKHNADQHKKTCACGDVVYENHKWDAGKVTKQPTCKDTGVKTYTCSVCGETKTESVAVTTNHTWGNWTKVDDNNHKHTCSVCGKSETAAHGWNSGVVTTQPTEEKTGIRVYTCSGCGGTKEEVIPKADHTHNYGSEWKNDSSNHWVECSCGDKNKIALHTYDTGKVEKPSTCKVEGSIRYTCTVCGYSRDEVIPKSNEHSFDRCEVVDDSQHRKICSVCGIQEVSSHIWGEEKLIEEPTHLQEGKKECHCEECAFVKTEAVERLQEHTYCEWKKYNSEQHKKECACGDIIYENHIAGEWEQDGDNKILKCMECGEVLDVKENDPGETTPPDNPELPTESNKKVVIWTVAIFALVVLLVVILVLIIRKKKSKS